ncbi:MAG: DEAD/DEAH box helicase, partial [Armatimonadetes bacterium]|nr:DEAD/DEAH box helicase [Armatimonadota bacterium]
MPLSLFQPYVRSWFESTFERVTPPQAQAWPQIALGNNTLIFSPTGSGKTLAAFLACLNDLFRMGEEGLLRDQVYVLYVSPLKALNNDIQKNLLEPLRGIREHAERMGLQLPVVRSMVRTGDTPQRERQAMARKPPHVLITTPESLFIILATQRFRLAFEDVRYVIVDEIHALCDNKRGVHLSVSLERLQHAVGREFVRIGCSATQRPLEEIARFLVGVGRECAVVDVGGRKNLDVKAVSPVDNLAESMMDAIWSSCYDRVLQEVHANKTTLIFTNSRYKTERTALRLNELEQYRAEGEPARIGAHHGSMSKEHRLEMEDKLKSGELDALVATSSLELGIDVGFIDSVIQLDSTKSVSTGLQRIGRAGHLLDATSKGRLIALDRDDLIECAVTVRAIMQGDLDRTRIPQNCLDVIAQHVVGAVAAQTWDPDELLTLFRRSHCYRDFPTEDYYRVLEMLAANYSFHLDQPPFEKLNWDKINRVLSPARSTRSIAFRACGTIPDEASYDVTLEAKDKRVGRLDEMFVNELRPGDIFVLGSTAWKV